MARSDYLLFSSTHQMSLRDKVADYEYYRNNVQSLLINTLKKFGDKIKVGDHLFMSHRDIWSVAKKVGKNSVP
ncbi:hypothetical protein SAMN02745131_03833 [Flavisolibacter ginsengisoli DSM 18119]|jgi:hypothetical protein|uniref:Uncharacterized protein n=1 Tax=Flavisolibacter ginsengisoli DSM 18119 TaxID=1121884 RepID=A0A1M5FI47_9BACT|nr:hypothetical protein SAMN02745131_03833 [Flavisolibacter ginsengisoli DSM 18119]